LELPLKLLKMKNFTTKPIAIFVGVFLIGCLSAQIPSNGLVSYFPFSGNANDQSGSLITGSVLSGGYPANTPPVLTDDRNGTPNSAYDFVPAVNSTSYIDLGQPVQYEFGTTSSFSISLWMKFTTYLVAPTMFGNSRWHMRIRNLSGQDHLNFVFGSISFNSDQLLTPGSWTHVVGVYNQPNETMELYLNGEPTTGFSYDGFGPIGPSVASLSTSGNAFDGTPTDATQFGIVSTTIYTGFKGVMDDLLVYNRPLTAEEVAGIYTATEGPSTVQEGFNLNEFTVGPNPGNGMVNVRISGVIPAHSTLKLYTMDGRLVMDQPVTGSSQQVDLGNVVSGNYLMKLTTPFGVQSKNVCVAR
jgi:hypothetical protein